MQCGRRALDDGRSLTAGWHTHPQMEEAWEGVLQGRVRTGPRGQTCDDDLSPCSSGPSPADCRALVHAFIGLGGPRDLPAAVP